ncbi:hypothetical protein BGW38_008608 [Lunasporangiospora selenospora]|uniref:Uncharacterized protein n=1 Tax=Lunasporangiospora selenospora TaxID=979761 RepID=A0A9P6FXX5_9FUNG|nr:hypothetical protein BGW38_008608 [Lunasporangiospora selenospora]
MTDTEDIQQSIDKIHIDIQDVELMINSLNDVRSSVHHIFHLLQGRTEPQSRSGFREHAKYTYEALESLSKLAASSDVLLSDTQALELPKLVGPSPISLESKRKEAAQEENAAASLSIDDTLLRFTIAMRRSKQKVHVTRLGNQPHQPTSAIKISVEGVLNAIIMVETNKREKCTAVARVVVFGSGEENFAWEESNHLVFRKITQIAIGSVDFFTSKAPNALLGLVLVIMPTNRFLLIDFSHSHEY